MLSSVIKATDNRIIRNHT